MSGGTLLHAVLALDLFVRLAWTHRLVARVPAAPANVPVPPWGGIWPVILYGTGCAWIVVFLLLVLGHYHSARVIAVLAVLLELAQVLRAQSAGQLPMFGTWTYWALLDVVAVLAMAAFYPGAPPVARRPWLLAWPAAYLLVYVPSLAIQAAGQFGWLPDAAGLCCLLVSVARSGPLPKSSSHSRASSSRSSCPARTKSSSSGTYWSRRPEESLSVSGGYDG
jgi:hypothetical protein